MQIDHKIAPSLSLTAAQCETARLSRDPRFDGRFFVAVLSTSIYCRPICPVQPAQAKNVQFYQTAAAAAEAGFRPCLRCRPEAAPGTPAWAGTSAVVGRALRLINEGALDQARLITLAERLGLTTRHLNRLFTRHLGASPGAVARTRRLHFAKRLLDDTDLPVGDVALAAGYGSVRRCNDEFLKIYGRSPSQLRRKTKLQQPPGGFSLRLRYRPPLHWTNLLAFFGRRVIPGIELVTGESYTRSIATGKSAGWFRISSLPDEPVLELALHGVEPSSLMTWVRRIRQQFDLDCDPRELAEVFGKDPLLGKAWHEAEGLRLPGSTGAFETCVRAILGQQVSVAAARTLCSRLVARYGMSLDLVDAPVTKLFPTPEKLQRVKLEKIGVMPQRACAIRSLAASVQRGDVDFYCGDVEVVSKKLLSIPGIGPWTVDYVRMRALGDPNAFPADDVIIRDYLGKGKRLDSNKVHALSRGWQPWRAYAAVLIWQHQFKDQSDKS